MPLSASLGFLCRQRSLPIWVFLFPYGVFSLTPALQNLPMEDMLPPDGTVGGEIIESEPLSPLQRPPEMQVTPLAATNFDDAEALTASLLEVPPLDIIALQGIQLRRFGQRCDDAEAATNRLEELPAHKPHHLSGHDQLGEDSRIIVASSSAPRAVKAQLDPVTQQGPDDFLQLGSFETDETNASATTLIDLLEYASAANHTKDIWTSSVNGTKNKAGGPIDTVSSLSVSARNESVVSVDGDSSRGDSEKDAEEWRQFLAAEQALGTSSHSAKLRTVNVDRSPDAAGFNALSTILCVLALFVGAPILMFCVAQKSFATIPPSVLGENVSNREVRLRVEALAPCSWGQIKLLLPDDDRYDCAFSKPVSSRMLVRLQARVVQATVSDDDLNASVHGGTCTGLTTPFSQRSCVVFSAACSRRLHEGVPCVPMAFSAASLDFLIVPIDSPDGSCIRISGNDVCLFDMSAKAKFEECSPFAGAPEHWQDFVLAHRSSTATSSGPSASNSCGRQMSAALRADSSLLEFQECALLVDTVATFVGELHRAADGALSLRPMRQEREPWRTSWESCNSPVMPSTSSANFGGCGDQKDSFTSSSIHLPQSSVSTTRERSCAEEQVLVSDDPSLLPQHSEISSHPKHVWKKLLAQLNG